MLTTDKHSSLLNRNASDEEKSFMNIDTWMRVNLVDQSLVVMVWSPTPVQGGIQRVPIGWLLLSHQGSVKGSVGIQLSPLEINTKVFFPSQIFFSRFFSLAFSSNCVFKQPKCWQGPNRYPNVSGSGVRVSVEVLSGADHFSSLTRLSKR